MLGNNSNSVSVSSLRRNLNLIIRNKTKIVLSKMKIFHKKQTNKLHEQIFRHVRNCKFCVILWFRDEFWYLLSIFSKVDMSLKFEVVSCVLTIFSWSCRFLTDRQMQGQMRMFNIHTIILSMKNVSFKFIIISNY